MRAHSATGQGGRNGGDRVGGGRTAEGESLVCFGQLGAARSDPSVLWGDCSGPRRMPDNDFIRRLI